MHVLQVVLLFPCAFWEPEARETFGRVAPLAGERGEAFLFYSCAAISGGAVLIALMAGALRRWRCVGVGAWGGWMGGWMGGRVGGWVGGWG